MFWRFGGTLIGKNRAISTDRWKSPIALNIAKEIRDGLWDGKLFGDLGEALIGKNRAISTDRWKSPMALNIAKEMCDSLWDGKWFGNVGGNSSVKIARFPPIGENRPLLWIFQKEDVTVSGMGNGLAFGGTFIGKNRAISTDRWKSPIALNIANNGLAIWGKHSSVKIARFPPIGENRPWLWTLQKECVTVFGMANGLAMWGEIHR